MDLEAKVRIMLNDFYEGSNQKNEDIANAAVMFSRDMKTLFHKEVLAAQQEALLLNTFKAWVPIAIQFIDMPEHRIKAVSKNITFFLSFKTTESIEVQEKIKNTNIISIFSKAEQCDQ